MKNVSIFRVKEKKSDKAPDYEMIASVQKGDGSYDRHYIGKCWSRTSQSGVKYLSCSLNDTRVYNEKTYIGYSIHADTAKNAPEAQNGANTGIQEARESTDEEDFGPF